MKKIILLFVLSCLFFLAGCASRQEIVRFKEQLNYLEESGKIAILKEGIIWIYKEDISKKLKAKLEKSVTIM